MSGHLHVVCPACGAANRLPAAKLRDKPACGKCKAALFTGKPIELTEATFDSHLETSDIPLVVDFWAPWCGPCKSMAPHFAEAAARLEPAVRLAKVNTDDNQRLAGRYQIRGIPTVVVFRGGKEVARQSGAMDLNRLLTWIRSA
jgi:thioredoxin 2